MSINLDFPSGAPTGNIYLDSLIWGGSLSAGPGQPTTIYWTFSQTTTLDAAYGFATTSDWLSYEKAALQSALTQWSNVADISFVYTSDPNQADLEEFNVDSANMFLLTGDPSDLAYHEVPDDGFVVPLYGFFNWEGEGWTSSGLKQGGYGYTTLLHELGHGLGLAHPHDGGSHADATAFPGVATAEDFGQYELNQNIWTVMSYNDGWNQAEDPIALGIDAYGQVGTPMALDIAAVQYVYGANMSYRSGTDTYILPSANKAGTFWSCVWDAGGVDTISAKNATSGCIIDLNAAPLVGPDAGGYPSYVEGISGGFTIANGVTIENAIGGKAADAVIGNAAINYLIGGGGIDSLDGGEASDIYVIESAGDHPAAEIADSGSVGTDEVRFAAKAAGTLTLFSGDIGIETVTTGTGKVALNIDASAAPNALTMQGNQGNNVLTGSAFADNLSGGAGNDTYVVGGTGDVVTESASEGTDLVKAAVSYTLGANIENLTLTGTGDIDATGNSLANTLTGNDGANALDGLGGKDKLVGGKGDDTYVVDLIAGAKLEDTVTESANAGTDTIELRSDTLSLSKAIAVTLANNLENLDASNTGSTLLNLTGNNANNILTGNAANNTLDGKSGNDTLNGGAGKDTVTGGSGADIFVFDQIADDSQGDLIKDFVSGTDHIAFDTAAFSALTFNPDGSLAAGEFASSATDANDYLIYNAASGQLFYDQDGSGASYTSVLIATLGTSTHPTLSAADFAQFA